MREDYKLEVLMEDYDRFNFGMQRYEFYESIGLNGEPFNFVQEFLL